MISNKKIQNPSKFNSMAQIQIKCVKLSKQLNNSKSNRSNSSLNITSPPQNKSKLEGSIKTKLNSFNSTNPVSFSTPKNYFLLPTHNSNSSLSRSKTLHHNKMNLVNSHNDQLNESNKENCSQKCLSPMQNSMGFFAKTPREDLSSIGNSIKIVDDKPLSHRNKINVNSNNWNQIQMNDIKETEEDTNDIIKQTNERNSEFFCVRHPMKKAKYFIHHEKAKGKMSEDLMFCCSKCAIDLASQGKKIFDINEEYNEKDRDESNEMLNQIPEENSKNNIIDELAENLSEIDFNEINKRDINLSKFLKNLQILKQECSVAFEQLNSRKKDVIFFYDKQIIKLDQIYNNLLRVIEKEKNQSTAKLKQYMTSTTAAFNSMISQMDNNIKDMTFIFNDIEQNRPNIIKHMETDPFNLILSKYEEKLDNYQKYSQNLYVEKLLLEKMTNSSIKIYQKRIDEVLTPHLISLFSTFEVSTSYLKKDVNIESESPIPLEKNLPKYNVFANNNTFNKANNENNSIYISFENKEMFENAMRNSLTSAFKSNTNNMDITTISGNLVAPLLTPDLLSNFQMNGEKKLFDSSGYAKNSNSALSNKKENDFITTPKSTEKCIREFNSAQPGKLLNNLNKECSITINKNKNKRFQSTDKLQNKKYLTLLEKVNNNQNNTNVFYSNMMKTNGSMTSPPLEKTEKHETKGIFKSLDHKNNIMEFNKNNKFNENINGRSGNILQPSPFKVVQNKEIKNYEGFFNFIENKLQSDDNDLKNNCNLTNANTNNCSYQKTLFCSSPHFKDL